MIETVVKVSEVANNAQEQVGGKNAFNPDKRIDSSLDKENIDRKRGFNPDSRIEQSVNQDGSDVKDRGTDNPINIITQNEALEGDRHPITGVLFERRVITLPEGEKIEGVFPRFNSLFDAQIPEDLYLKSDYYQFKECNRQLLHAIDTMPSFKKLFSKEQIEQIREGVFDGTAPDGFVWHHDAECGRIQLVDADIHSTTGHTGGRLIWGGGSENR